MTYLVVSPTESFITEDLKTAEELCLRFNAEIKSVTKVNPQPKTAVRYELSFNNDDTELVWRRWQSSLRYEDSDYDFAEPKLVVGTDEAKLINRLLFDLEESVRIVQKRIELVKIEKDKHEQKSKN